MQTPLILRITGFLGSEKYTVMVLSNGYGPSSFVYFADIVPVFPGMIGSFVHSAFVHPHVVKALYMTSGLVPIFFTVNVHDTGPLSSRMSPKLWTVLSISMLSPIFS